MSEVTSAMENKEATSVASSARGFRWKAMAFPPSSVEVLLGFFHLLLPKVRFLEKENVFSFGPNPILRPASKGGHIGKHKVQSLRVVSGSLWLTRFQSFNGVRNQFSTAFVNQPNLYNFLSAVVQQVRKRNRKSAIIRIPVSIVHGMDGHIVPVLVSMAFVQNHADDPVGS